MTSCRCKADKFASPGVPSYFCSAAVEGAKPNNQHHQQYPRISPFFSCLLFLKVFVSKASKLIFLRPFVFTPPYKLFVKS